MSSTKLQTTDAIRTALTETLLPPDTIEQQRFINDCTPKSSQSSESDDSVNNEIAVQGFERFRESNSCTFPTDKNSSSTATTAFTAPPPLPPSDTITEYCNESLYSYSFTPVSRVNKAAAKIKKQILNRGVDYMQRIRHRDSMGRRFSQPDIRGLDPQWVDIKPYPSMIDMALVKQSSGNSPPPSAPPMATPPTLPHQLHDSTAETSQEEELKQPIDDDDGFSLARRQTIQVVRRHEKNQHHSHIKRTASISSQYVRALHAPSRFLPQNQAILTTDANGTILLFNDMASLCFSMDKSYIGSNILTTIEEPFQSEINDILKRRKAEQQQGLVLVCGVVVPIRKMNLAQDSDAAASLWLKEKVTDEGKCIYIWIFEEIYETCLTAHLDEKGSVTKLVGTTKELFGYESDQVIHNPISLLIPALSSSSNHNNVTDDPGVNLAKIDQIKFFGGHSKLGLSFPTMITSSSHRILKIVSLPSIAGLITIHSTTGKIQSINAVPAKYLFGYSPDSLVEKFNIDQIIPQFSEVVNGLKQCNLLQYACTVNNHVCRWAISDLCSAENYKSSELNQSLKSLERTPSISANGGQTLPVIYAVHRDKSQFEIQLQLRLIQSEQEDLISIWVTYDRIHALKRSKRSMASTTTTANKAKTDDAATYTVPLSPDQHHQHPLSTSASISSSCSSLAANNNNIISQEVEKQHQQDDDEEDEDSPLTIKKRPSIRPYGFSSFGGTPWSLEENKKGMFPSSLLSKHDEDEEEETLSATSSSSSSTITTSVEQVNGLEVKENKQQQHPMDAYVVIGILGEGAYGTAKLAYRKDDINKTKVVIKFIAKSRIIVDSWIRDRSMGSLIPLEIHILQNLAHRPHISCCCLEKYMEDDDFYFVVMKLFGKSSMDLFDYIELNQQVSEQQILDIFIQVCLAVQHIHSLGIVHRDIKDENILLDDEGIVHLIDFGSAAYFKKGRTFDTFSGTLDYCAPEILKGSKYEGPPQDIWSLGTLLYTLIYRENPFYNVDEILEHDLRIPFVLSEGSIDLIKKMLNRDVEKRYTIHQVLAHPWLKQ